MVGRMASSCGRRFRFIRLFCLMTRSIILSIAVPWADGMMVLVVGIGVDAAAESA